MPWQDDSEKILIYDLRQVYAIDIVGETLKAIKIARTSEKYPLWYHLLKRDLLTEISQKLKEKELALIYDKIAEVKKILHKNSYAYLGNTKDAQAHEDIEDALCSLEMLMYRLMEKHGMFGRKEEVELL